MPNLNSTDGLILVLYLFCVVAIGFSLRLNIKTSKDFFQAGRALPTLIGSIAFIAASLGLPEIIGMGAAGAHYGFRTALFFSLGAIPALLFAGVYMMPLYYGSGARTVPEYLGLRFDQKTRLFNACTFAAMTVASCGIALNLMGRIFQTLHLLDPLFYAYGWPRQGIFAFCILFAASIALAYLLFAGLAGAMVNQVLQFLVVVASFLPLVILGLRNIGGWAGLQTAIPSVVAQSAMGIRSLPVALISLTFGFILGAGHWCTDFRLLQNALAAKDIVSARCIPLFAAAIRLVLPFLLILPGAIAIGMPTPQSTTLVRNENGTIYHEITVVPPEEAQGQGLVPAFLDPATGKPRLDSTGHALLNFDRATPAMLIHLLPTGMLGLGIAALLSCLMSGLAAGVTALSAVVTYDIYPSCITKGASEEQSLRIGRWSIVGVVLLSVGVAFSISSVRGNSVEEILYPLLLSFALVTAPQLATFLLGMFWKRATSLGAFAGLAAGTMAALLHHGLTLPIGVNPGLQGGWIVGIHHYPGFIAQCFCTALIGFAINAIVHVAVSLCSEAKTEKELKLLVRSLTPKYKKIVAGWKRPEVLAAGILLAAIVLGILFV